MTFLWEAGDPLEVEMDSTGQPCHLRWRGRAHAVYRVAGHWRIDEGWWLRRIWREYFQLTTETGLLVTIFRDLETDAWYVQRLYD